MTKNIFKTQRILIAVDDSNNSEKAVTYGYHLAELLDADVALVNVIDPPTTSSYSSIDPVMGAQPMYVPELSQIQEDTSNDLLKRLKAIWQGDPSNVTTFNKIGQIKQEILSTAAEWSADLIILGTHGRTGFDHFISGSVSESVARHSICPVLIVPYKDEDSK